MVLVANIVSLIAMILMCINGLIKNKKKFLIVQCTQMGFCILANALLGGSTGVVVNSLGILRNVLAYFGKLNGLIMYIVLIINTLLSIIFNTDGLIGIAPLFAAIPYTLLMNKFNDKSLKVLTLYTCFPWAIYDFFVKNYVACIFDLITAVTCLIAIIQMNKKKG